MARFPSSSSKRLTLAFFCFWIVYILRCSKSRWQNINKKSKTAASKHAKRVRRRRRSIGAVRSAWFSSLAVFFRYSLVLREVFLDFNSHKSWHYSTKTTSAAKSHSQPTPARQKSAKIESNKGKPGTGKSSKSKQQQQVSAMKPTLVADEMFPEGPGPFMDLEEVKWANFIGRSFSA